MTKVTITRKFHFESAHFLPLVPDGHKCKNIHGHNYEMEVTVSSPDLRNGFVIDFWDLDKIVDHYVATVDHKLLNDISGLENPTAEHIALWFLENLQFGPHSPMRVDKVQIWETKDCSAIATGPTTNE